MVVLKIFVYLFNSLSINKINNKVMKEKFLKSRSKEELRSMCDYLGVEKFHKLPISKLQEILITYSYRELVESLKSKK